ncbi:tRNA preQ1(34) S-adenosylmethionine ribosyltransferase-isomerase QueA [Elongatibacter sediminis]|uniref:S-adenosylmethionine:tRNA ribosyltransferase-isomerase n=1 Tax=Elongatibacter sediminis TaxID=3119006 RepID=A0AAW9RI51_9GAMM
MHRSDFQYDLPPELIAQQPLARRSDSRLLQVSRGNATLSDRVFRDLPELLEPGDLLVFNDTRVLPARLFARKPSGGRVEILLERLLDEQRCIAQLRVSKPPRAGGSLLLEDGTELAVDGREDAFFRLRSPAAPLAEIVEKLGHMPLPPYIDREDTAEDSERYQTVLAQRPGAVAAPTAGLHFDTDLLERLERRGIRRCSVTLHVGAGTFQPVRAERIEDHRMHAEYLEVPESVCEAVAGTKAGGGRVIAVGTTSVRSLETAARDGGLRPYAGDSRLFIYPGFDFRVIDGMITNFHLPESTLLMLVSAFAGLDTIRFAYAHAIDEQYRFFSYGDAMLLT